ncbi:HEAT repeat domain-containing protein, partial [Limnofasciculus baicalensis]
EAGAKYAPDILNILKDEKIDKYIRSRAADALANLGEAGAKYAPDILNILKDEKVDSSIRRSAAEALGNLGEAGAKYAPDILNILKDEKVDLYIRHSAAYALGNIRKLELNEVIVVLNNLYQPNQQNINFETWRFLTYFLSGGTDEVKTLLTWLGNPQETPTQLKYEDGKKTLELFLSIWKDSNDFKRLQKDLADKIAEVTRLVTWKPQDITLLQSHSHNLKQAGYNQADTVESAINDLAVWQWIFNARNTIIIHAAFWFILIFLYPKFPQIQAIFFWNPWVRKIIGVGYVGLFLTWIPFLRRKLFEPFKPSLLADAKLDYFNDKTYFPESPVKIPISGETLPITQALPTIKGQLVLFGDSGLGKSMFIRHLVKNSPRIVVYLPARKCDDGVIEAIQTKLHGQAQDAEFLKNLIYSGAIDICIDGLNEVSADTRAKITNFVEHYFRGNIIMTSQPLEWIPPSTAKSYWLQPLEKQQIEEFLVYRAEELSKDTKIQNTDYKEACTKYLAEALNPQQAPEELAAAKRILSNPMDLTLISLMLSQGKQPNLFRLQEEQYKLMAAEYWEEWHKEFPLKKFSEAVYEMRIKDEEVIPVDGFYQVLMSLADDKYKMVVSRQWRDEGGEAKKEYLFRHDKIMDFFLVQNFLGKGDEVQQLQVKHINDSRFRGVYFLLATFLPLDDAKELREKLIQYAADTKDHTVSDTFVQLLRTR